MAELSFRELLVVKLIYIPLNSVYYETEVFSDKTRVIFIHNSKTFELLTGEISEAGYRSFTPNGLEEVTVSLYFLK